MPCDKIRLSWWKLAAVGVARFSMMSGLTQKIQRSSEPRNRKDSQPGLRVKLCRKMVAKRRKWRRKRRKRPKASGTRRLVASSAA